MKLTVIGGTGLIGSQVVQGLTGAGHLPMWDDADAVSRTILEVTSRVDAAAPSPA